MIERCVGLLSLPAISLQKETGPSCCWELATPSHTAREHNKRDHVRDRLREREVTLPGPRCATWRSVALVGELMRS